MSAVIFPLRPLAYHVSKECFKCEGTGFLHVMPCPRCNGLGRMHYVATGIYGEYGVILEDANPATPETWDKIRGFRQNWDY